MPTPCARDGKGPGHQYGLPDLIEAGRRPLGLLPTPVARDTGRSPEGHPAMRAGLPGGARTSVTSLAVAARLLPTPTARAYGSNQSLSAGAAVRPSLATLASRRLLPTPTVADARSSANAIAGRRGDNDAHAGTALTDAARLLPTPRTSDGRGPVGHGQGGADLRTAVWLLPTPKATDGTKGCPAQRGSKGDLTLPSAAVRLDAAGEGGGKRGDERRLLPTPRVAATRTGRHAATSPTSRSGPSLEQATEIAGGVLPRELTSWNEAPAGWRPPPADGPRGRAWGPYAEAVARWEQLLGRPAPAPTQPGTHGKPVLAPVFVEWLMGLEAGWVTGLRLPRTLALRVLGNGVVPQQAAVALRLLLCPHRWAVNP